MRIDLNGRTALVTGAAQGIGAAIGHCLAQAGATLHLADRQPIPAESIPTGAIAHECDLAKQANAQRLVASIQDTGAAPDIFVNAAGGVAGQVGTPLESVTEQAWHALFQANVDSAMWLAQALAPSMKSAQSGRIVFIASGAGLRPSLTGIQGYTAAKHALVGLTRQLALEFGPSNITVNAVAPGFIRSNPSTEKQWQALGATGQSRLVESIHLRRLGRAEDIAYAVLFLVSDLASWTTGQVLSVDGGRA